MSMIGIVLCTIENTGKGIYCSKWKCSKYPLNIYLSEKMFIERSLPAPFPFISPDFFRLLADIVVDCIGIWRPSPQIKNDGDIVYVRGDFIGDFAKDLSRINQKKKKFILITHDSDFTLPRNDGKLLVYLQKEIVYHNLKTIYALIFVISNELLLYSTKS